MNNIPKGYKPFNLEQAKAGKPVVTRCGYPVRIVCFDRKVNINKIIALIDEGDYEDTISTTLEGVEIEGEVSGYDLFMLPQTKTMYTAGFVDHLGKVRFVESYFTKEKLEEYIDCTITHWGTNWVTDIIEVEVEC